MKKYIDFITEKWKNAANSFEKDFLKLTSNSVDGKTMENLRKRISVRLVTNDKDYLKYVSKPTFISKKILSERFAAIHETKPVLTLNKPIYVGFTVLELSKWLMYEFHYNPIKKNFDANWFFSDTDSLTHEIKSKDVYEEFFKHKHLFYFSGHQPEFFDETNKKVPGKMKDEFKGTSINKFIGLKSEMYCIASHDDIENNTAKGVNISIIEFN